MKKTTLFALCVPLLLGGLFCLHLVAQSETTTSRTGVSLSLLDPKVGELSERELLEMKVDRCRKIVEYTENMQLSGAPAGGAIPLAEAQAHLAAAKIELYRFTGEQDKLRTALDVKVKALSDRVRAIVRAYENGVATSAALYEAESQLLDALLECKRAHAPVPPGVGMPERMVEKTIGDKAFKVKVPSGEGSITHSMVVHVKIRNKDVMSFDRRYEACKTEIEDHIATILRASTVEERMEASLTTIKEKMKRAINGVLGTPWVVGILVTEFSLLEELQ